MDTDISDSWNDMLIKAVYEGINNAATVLQGQEYDDTVERIISNYENLAIETE